MGVVGSLTWTWWQKQQQQLDGWQKVPPLPEGKQRKNFPISNVCVCVGVCAENGKT